MFPTKILVCVDSPEHFNDCKTDVGWIARHLKSSLVLFHSAPERWMDAGPGLDKTDVDEAWLDGLLDDPALHNIEVEARSVATFSTLIDSIIHAAQDSSADMVMVLTHGRSGIAHMLYGSTAERVLRSCKIPVMTLDLQKSRKSKIDSAFDHIVCPVDFSDTAMKALDAAAELGARLKLPVSAIHVVDDYFAAAYPVEGIPSLDTYLPSLLQDLNLKIEKIAESVSKSSGAEVTGRCELGPLVPTMHDVVNAYNHPLLVMATAGRDSLGDHILGSRAERIVRSAHVPVLALPKVYLRK